MTTSARTTFGLARIGQIHVGVEDLQRATNFYRDTLGLRFLFDVQSMAFFDCGGIRLMLGVPEKPDQPRHASILYFSVADIKEAHGTLSSRGVEFVSEPHLVAKMETHDLWMAFFRDSEANTMALMSEAARS